VELKRQADVRLSLCRWIPWTPFEKPIRTTFWIPTSLCTSLRRPRKPFHLGNASAGQQAKWDCFNLIPYGNWASSLVAGPLHLEPLELGSVTSHTSETFHKICEGGLGGRDEKYVFAPTPLRASCGKNLLLLKQAKRTVSVSRTWVDLGVRKPRT